MEDSQGVEESSNLVNKLEMNQTMQPSIELGPSSGERQLLRIKAGETAMTTRGH